MSDCGVCVYNDFDEPASVWLPEVVTARKPHRCSECGRSVQPREKYQRTSILFDGSWEKWNTCLICAEIRKAFSCHGEMLGGVFWSDFEEADGFALLNESCFDKLQTVAAKKYLRQRWMEWKGL